MKTITMYELLGLVKDGKTPKIKFNNSIYEYHDKEHGYCRYYRDNTYICLDTDYYLFDILNDEVEILEEEKKIPEKLPIGVKQTKDGIFNTIVKDDIQYELNEKEEMICKKIHEIIDYLDYLKSKGE